MRPLHPMRRQHVSGRIAARLLPMILAVSAAAPAAADDYTVVPREFIYCTTCHGVELKGNQAVDAPRLNGMEPWYVRNQLDAFRNGWRGTNPADLTGMEMHPQATVLSADAVEDAVAFVAAVPRRPADATPAVSGDAEHGRSLFASCAACHGAHGEGNESLHAPRLAGQSDWYLARQLEKFSSGARGTAAGDTFGAQMRASVSVLADDNDINDVVAYINTLR